jgi:hypothetical protein
MGNSWQQLRHIRQAVSFLVVADKAGLSLHELHSICSDLSPLQVRRAAAAMLRRPCDACCPRT